MLVQEISLQSLKVMKPPELKFPTKIGLNSKLKVVKIPRIHLKSKRRVFKHFEEPIAKQSILKVNAHIQNCSYFLFHKNITSADRLIYVEQIRQPKQRYNVWKYDRRR